MAWYIMCDWRVAAVAPTFTSASATLDVLSKCFPEREYTTAPVDDYDRDPVAWLASHDRVMDPRTGAIVRLSEYDGPPIELPKSVLVDGLVSGRYRLATSDEVRLSRSRDLDSQPEGE